MSSNISEIPSDLLTPSDFGQGVDIVDIARIDRLVMDWGDRFTNRIYTSREQVICAGKFTSLAGRFAAKEAFVKAIGTGLRGIKWTDIEILNQLNGRPYFVLHGGAKTEFVRVGWRSCLITISHAAGVAIAMVTVMKDRDTSV
jgi:holo-[acyl-carrier protein] synthase